MMPTRRRQTQMLLRLMAGGLLAAAGCVRMVPPESLPPAQPPAAVPDRPLTATPPAPLRLDPQAIHRLQSQALAAQQDSTDAVIQRQNRFTAWLDQWHETWFRRLDDAVRRLDARFLTEDAPYDYQLSTFRLYSMMRLGGRSREPDFDYKVRFRANLALPGLRRKLHVYLDTAAREELPGRNLLQQTDETRLGLRTILKELHHSQLSLGGGMRFSSSRIVSYGKLDWLWRAYLEEAELCVIPGVFYYTDDGFGQKTVVTWTRPVGERQRVQLRFAERATEATHGFEFEQSLRFAWLRSGIGRGWVAQASVFPHLKSNGWFWDDALLNITWRDALYRKWIYYTLTPQIQFPREDDYHPKPSFWIGLDLLLGGRIGDLL